MPDTLPSPASSSPSRASASANGAAETNGTGTPEATDVSASDPEATASEVPDSEPTDSATTDSATTDDATTSPDARREKTSLLSRLRVIKPGLRKYWKYVSLTVLLSIFTALFEGVSIGMLIPFLQTMAEDGGSSFATGIEWLDVHVLGVNAPPVERIYRICGIILAATLLRLTAHYYTNIYTAKSRSRIVQNLRERLVDQLLAVSPAYYAQHKSGEIMQTLLGEVGRAASTIGVLFIFITSSMQLLMYGGLMVMISWELTLLTAVVIILMAFGLSRIVNVVRERGHEITDTNMLFAARCSEFLGGVKTVIAYNMQDFERERLHHGAKASADAVINGYKGKALLQPVSQAIISVVIIVLVVWAMQFLVLSGKLDIAYVLTFLFALFRTTPIINNLNNQRGILAETEAGLQNIADVLERSDKPYLEEGSRVAAPLTNEIAFENVDFAYEPGELVLEDVNLRIPQGKTTAIVGASGAGKSTLVDLIPRFDDPTRGRLLYDGVDFREFTVHSLRAQIGVVSQSTQIFNASVTENIAYGTPDATFATVREAAQQANALEFIEEMPEGFDTVLGDRGVRLSGGQRQRIAIARAILRNPEILILDEATSALDSISEQLVQQSLERLMQGRTVIAIAHRLSTIEHADWVVVLEDGRIVEQGTYEDLIDRRGQLWEYHAIQFQVA